MQVAPPPPPQRRSSIAVSLVALVGAVAVIALLSRVEFHQSDRHGVYTGLPMLRAGVAALITGALGSLVVAGIRHQYSERAGVIHATTPHRAAPWVLAASALAAMAALTLAPVGERSFNGESVAGGGFTRPERTERAEPDDGAESDPPRVTSMPISLGDVIKLAAIVGAVGVIAFGTWNILKDRRRKPEPGPGIESALSAAVSDTTNALLHDPDPRRAIIAAYARLLAALDSAGQARLAHEGPREHLARALEHVRLRPSAVTTVVGLFEIARFSSHPLTDEHRSEALAALDDARADLASPLASAGVS